MRHFHIGLGGLCAALSIGCDRGSDQCHGGDHDHEGELWELPCLEGDGFALEVPLFEFAEPENQRCYFLEVPDINDGEPVYVDRVLTAINPGSHHMNVFRVNTVIPYAVGGLDPDGDPGVQTLMLGDYPARMIDGKDHFDSSPCWNSANWADWPLVANSQHSSAEDPFTDWVLPDQVAIRFEPGELLMVQTHYVNTSDQPTDFGARVGINFYGYDDSRPPIEMGSLFATQQSIRICEGPSPVTYSGTCRFPDQDVTVIAANGHFHKRGVNFALFPWDGQSITHPDPDTQFYESARWDHPYMDTDLDVEVPAGGGVWWDCMYQWQAPTVTDCEAVDAKDPLQEGRCCYTFGGNTDVGEHCNVFLYYYPKVSDILCF